MFSGILQSINCWNFINVIGYKRFLSYFSVEFQNLKSVLRLPRWGNAIHFRLIPTTLFFCFSFYFLFCLCRFPIQALLWLPSVVKQIHFIWFLWELLSSFAPIPNFLMTCKCYRFLCFWNTPGYLKRILRAKRLLFNSFLIFYFYTCIDC